MKLPSASGRWHNRTCIRLIFGGILALVLKAASVGQTITPRIEPKDGVGVKLWADGNKLLVDDAGAGFYLIGSSDDTDDGNNVASFVRGNNGVMRAMNGASTPYIPYKFTFRKDAKDAGKVFFDASVGPAPFDFTTISLPLDGRKQMFTHWRHSGSPKLGRYEDNPYTYTPPGGGPIYIQFVQGSITWGEMIGPDYTVRITLTSRSNPNGGIAFVSAPSLSSGVRNVEFGFGRLKKGQSAYASGYIEVRRTDSKLFAQDPITVESESTPYHQIGRKDGDGWSVRVGDTPSRFMIYGPYTTGVLPGRRTATFRLMLDNVKADNREILKVDVFDSATGRTLATRTLKRKDFAAAMTYQDFEVQFNAAAGQKLEFRTFWLGSSYARQDNVKVK